MQNKIIQKTINLSEDELKKIVRASNQLSLAPAVFIRFSTMEKVNKILEESQN